MAVLLLNGVIAFGIATRRLLSVSFFVRQVVSYSLLAALLAGIYAATYFTTAAVVRWLQFDDGHLPHIFAAIVTLVAFAQLHALLRRFVEDVFLHLVRGMSFDSKRLLKKADTELSSVRTNEDLMHLVKAFLSEGGRDG